MININDKVLVSPSILAGDFVNMQQSIQDIERWGADMVHCDVMDGVYVKNLTFGMPMIKAIRTITSLPLDVHLMITKPERYVDAFVASGADILTFHPEASDEPMEALKAIRAKGIKSGIVFNPNVDIDKYKDLFPYCDMILIMSVYAGLGGQKFIGETVERIRKTADIIKELGLDIPIEIDGGINENNADLVKKAGASILVAGSAIFKSDNPQKTVEVLRGDK